MCYMHSQQLHSNRLLLISEQADHLVQLPSFHVLHPRGEGGATVFAAVPSDFIQHADAKIKRHSVLTSLGGWICARFSRSS